MPSDSEEQAVDAASFVSGKNRRRLDKTQLGAVCAGQGAELRALPVRARA
jgi:hypothetical protein